MTSPDFAWLRYGLIAGILFVYLLLPTKNYYWDGIGFAQTIEDAPSFNSSLIHPNHLLYTAVGYLEYGAVQATGLNARSLTVLRIANSMVSALCAYLIFELLISQGCSQAAGALLTLLFAFSATWWRYSTDANSYIPATFFILVCFRRLQTGKSPWRVATAHAAAMLLHQLALLFFPVALVSLWRRDLALPVRRRIIGCLEYSFTAGAFTAAAYAFAYRWKQQSAASTSFTAWIASHSPEVGFSFDILRNAVLSLQGTLQLFLGGRVLAVWRQHDPMTIALVTLLALLVIAFVYQLARNRKRTMPAPPKSAELSAQPVSVGTLIVWTCCYLGFLFFWLPWNTFYRLFYVPALILLIGTFMARRKRIVAQSRVRCLALAVSAVFVFNLTFYILPNSRAESNPPLQMALAMQDQWKPGTTIYFASFITDDWTARYFNPATTWRALPEGNLALVTQELAADENSGHEIWLETTALDRLAGLPGGSEWLASHAVPGESRELVNAQHRIIFQRISGVSEAVVLAAVHGMEQEALSVTRTSSIN